MVSEISRGLTKILYYKYFYHIHYEYYANDNVIVSFPQVS